MSIDSTAVVVGDTLVITDDRGSRIIIVRSPGQPVGIATRGGAHLTTADTARVIDFLGGRPAITEEEILARIAQTEYYDLLTEKAREIHDVLERAVRERVDEPAGPGTVLHDARMVLGLDGGTGARQIDDGPACRVCGCTQNRACPGGCSWVPDPAGQGHLCSACTEAGRG